MSKDTLYQRVQTALRRRGLHGCACEHGHRIDLSDKPEVVLCIVELVEQLSKEREK